LKKPAEPSRHEAIDDARLEMEDELEMENDLRLRKSVLSLDEGTPSRSEGMSFPNERANVIASNAGD
jgi:hypothetical protein